MERTSFHLAQSLVAGAVAAALCGGAVAAAQLPAFNRLDADRSGFIEPPEAQQVLERQQFVGADRDRDMRLSASEYGQLQSRMQAQSAQAQPKPQQQAQAGQQGKPPQTDITITERPSQVQVEQQPPQVTVQQQPPEITVVQPDPKVTVQQPEPEVTVRQAQPQVDVQQQGQPQVAIEEAGEPEVQYRESAQAAGDPSQQEQTASAQSLQDKKINELSGMSVANAEGQGVGEVEKIVKSTLDNQLYAVIAGGGFLGIGEDRAAVRLDSLSLQEDKLIWQSASGKDVLEQRRYDEQNYSEIQQDDMTVAELTGQGGGQQASFQQLDRNSDGSISQAEAGSHPLLQQQWNQADADRDGELSQSEFSAFEQQSIEAPAQQGGGSMAPQGAPAQGQ